MLPEQSQLQNKEHTELHEGTTLCLGHLIK